MEALVRLAVALSCLLLSFSAHSAEVSPKFGVGVAGGADFGTVKYLELGLSGTIIGPWCYTLATGLWTDSRPGYATTPLAVATTGVRAVYGPLMASTEWGLAGIVVPDRALSTYYQFSNLTQAAVRTSEGHFVGAFYRHYSNAGIKQPNLGRDFVGITVGVAF